MVGGADRASDTTAGSAIDAAVASWTMMQRGRWLAAASGMRQVWAALFCVPAWWARRAPGGPPQRLSPPLTPGRGAA